MSSDDSNAADIVLPPYARAMGVYLHHMDHDVPLLACEATERVFGRPGFWHGGSLAGMLEVAALTALQAKLGGNGTMRLKPINVTIQFLRGAPHERVYAAGRVVRLGRRLAQLSAEAWQGDDRDRLFATAQMNVIIAARDAQ